MSDACRAEDLTTSMDRSRMDSLLQPGCLKDIGFPQFGYGPWQIRSEIASEGTATGCWAASKNLRQNALNCCRLLARISG